MTLTLQSLKKIHQLKLSELDKFIEKNQRMTIHGGTDAYEFVYVPTPAAPAGLALVCTLLDIGRDACCLDSNPY